MNHIHFVGYSAHHPEDFIFDVPKGHGCYLLLLTNTPARFWLEDGCRDYPAHHAILYPPFHPIRYGACNAPYGNDWLRFTTDESFVTDFPLPASPFPVSDPEYCHNLFQLLTWERTQRSYDVVVSRLLHILFSKLWDDVRHYGTTPHDHELLSLRREILNNPQKDWNVAAMADRLHISAGYLQLLYKNQFGISCMDDVIKCRLDMAKDSLSHTGQNISEIAVLCGYKNTEHFCRQFKKCCGLTPGQFRKKSRSADTSSTCRTVAGEDFHGSPR